MPVIVTVISVESPGRTGSLDLISSLSKLKSSSAPWKNKGDKKKNFVLTSTRRRLVILIYFGQVPNYPLIEEYLKIKVYQDKKKNIKEIIINHKRTRMVKDGED